MLFKLFNDTEAVSTDDKSEFDMSESNEQLWIFIIRLNTAKGTVYHFDDYIFLSFEKSMSIFDVLARYGKVRNVKTDEVKELK